MAELDIPRELVERLRRIAEREQRPVDDLVADLLALYAARQQGAAAALDAMEGMFDDALTDLSTSVRETMRSYYARKA
jgi:hypothetical protein